MNLLKKIVLLIFVTLLATCDHSKTYHFQNFAEFIHSFTFGSISKKSNIIIQLQHPINDSTLVHNGIIDFNPPIDGQLSLSNSQTLVFKPNHDLKQNQNYNVTVRLGEIYDLPDSLNEFKFQVKTYEQKAKILLDGFHPSSQKNTGSVLGKVVTRDVADINEIKKSIQISGVKKHQIEWLSSNDATVFPFKIKNVSKDKNAKKLKIYLEGNEIEAKEDDEKEIEIPAQNDFKVNNLRVVSNPDQFILVQCTERLNLNQSLEGLIQLGNNIDYSYEILDHEIKIFPKEPIYNDISISLSSLIENESGKKLGKEWISKAVFSGAKPSFNILKQGNILTSNHEFSILIEAVHLKGLTVKVNKVPRKNVRQFFQENDIEDRYRMDYVSTEVITQHFDLSKLANKPLNVKQKYFLDLKNTFKQEAGAIYEITLTADAKDAAIECASALKDDQVDEDYKNYEYFLEPEKWTEKAYGYSYYDDYWYYDGYYYDDSDDPCKKRFYSSLKKQKNLLVSDLGLSVKIGKNHQALAYTSNMVSTIPMHGVQVTYFSFSGEIVGQSVSDDQGFGTCDLTAKPFFAKAQKGDQFMYLKLNDAQALSTSKYDVDGSNIEEGIKAFIYSERGVRRPGDTIYLAFMIEDKDHKIPAQFPVKIQLRDARGRLYYKAINKKEVSGLYTFKIPTNSDDPTGSWWAQIELAHLKFSKYLKVENVRPNRLKVILNTNKIWGQDPESQVINFESRWLHGAKASNLKVNMVANISKATQGFDQYKGYQFFDPLNSYETNKKQIASTTLNEDGKAKISPNLKVNNQAPGMLQIHLESKVFENAGGFSIGYDKVLFAPYKSFVGVKSPKADEYTGMLLTDKSNYFSFVNIDENQKTKNSQLKVSYYRIERKWWYDYFQDDLSSYISAGKLTLVKKESIATKDGKANSAFKAAKNKWGKYLVVVENEDGHRSGQFFWVDWPYWSRSSRSSNSDMAHLSFRTNQNDYVLGENIEVTFPSAASNRAFITIENGTGILYKTSVVTTDGETKVYLPTDNCKAPNAYVSITYLQQHANTDNDLPIRMFGIQEVKIADPGSHLNPTINTADVYKPNESYKIEVGESNGKAMAYTLAIVDEGLLDLTRFTTPDPHQHFYAKEALGVKTWDMYKNVMGAFGSGIFPRLSVGGDAALKANKSAKKSRFKPVVMFFGPFLLKEGEKKSHQIKIPNYVGAVKVMVVAGKDLKYGNAEKVVTVKKDLMVQGNLPRVLSPQEEIQLPINLFINNDKIKNVDLEVTSSSNIKANPSKYTTDVKGKSQKTILWKISTLKSSGPAWIKIVAKANGERSEYKVDLNIRTPLPNQSTHKSVMLNAGTSESFATEQLGFTGNNEIKVEFSSSYPINLGKRLDYLIRYPYGCLEQTTSSVFPQLLLLDLLDLDQAQRNEMKKNITDGIQRLQKFATSDGGFNYWIGGSYQNEWAELYAGHFLIKAKEKGYAVPTHLLKNWSNKQKRIARSPRYDDPYKQYNSYIKQAYRLYLMALSGDKNMSAMNRLRGKNLNAAEKALLAAAYAIVGQESTANSLINQSSTIKKYNSWGYSYGSTSRDEALLLLSATEVNNYRRADQMAKKVSENLNSNRWLSTQSTAFSLIAMNQFNEHFDLGGEVNIELNGKKYQSSKGLLAVNFTEANWPQQLKVKNNAGKNVYVHYNHIYAPTYQEFKAGEWDGKNLKIDLRYYNLQNEEIQLNEITHGLEFYAKIKVTNLGSDGPVENIMLDYRIAGAIEINNERLFSGSSSSEIYHYKDILDDRILYSFDLKSRYSKTFKVFLTAGYKGKFYMPSTKVEAMYDYQVIDRTKGQWITIE